MSWQSINKMMDMKGRRVLITGATGGLGRVLVETMAELGADVVLIDRPGSCLDEFAKEITNRWSCFAKYYFCDLENEDERHALINDLTKLNQGLSVLINNAAFVGTSGLEGWAVPFEKQTVDTWRRAVELNLTAVFDLTQGFVPQLKKSPGASIINIASIYGEFGPDWRLYEGTSMANPAAYAASKGGLMQLTRWLSTTLAPDIRVNSVSPGGIFRNQPDAFVQKYVSRTPLGRMANEDDFRGVIAYLATDLSMYVTGQNLRVDGGWSAW